MYVYIYMCVLNFIIVINYINYIYKVKLSVELFNKMNSLVLLALLKRKLEDCNLWKRNKDEWLPICYFCHFKQI